MQQLAVFSTSAAGGVDEETLTELIRAADITGSDDTQLGTDTITCLANGIAYETAIHIDTNGETAGNADTLLSALRPMADAAGIDMNIVPAGGRRKKLNL